MAGWSLLNLKSWTTIYATSTATFHNWNINAKVDFSNYYLAGSIKAIKQIHFLYILHFITDTTKKNVIRITSKIVT